MMHEVQNGCTCECAHKTEQRHVLITLAHNYKIRLLLADLSADVSGCTEPFQRKAGGYSCEVDYVHCNAIRLEVFNHSEVETVTSGMEILFAEHNKDNTTGNKRFLSNV